MCFKFLLFFVSTKYDTIEDIYVVIIENKVMNTII